jgi:nuclear GTP-binding protein
MLHYRIPEFTDCDHFLALLSRRFGRLKKGGRPDLSAAAKQVLNDWNSGKLRYYTEPPEENRTDDEQQQISMELVQEFAKEFDLDALDQDIRVIVDGKHFNLTNL